MPRPPVGAFGCSCSSNAAPAAPSLAPGCRSLQIRMTRPAGRLLQLQQLLERRAGRDVVGSWLPIAAIRLPAPSAAAAARARAGRDVVGSWLPIAAPGRNVAGTWLPIAADPNDTAARRRLQLQLLFERRAGRDVAGARLPIAADPDDAAGCRRLQLQQLLERRAGRDVVGAW
ncbi:hypothetical protein ACFSR7_06035 [Cohnella sp. GCM10020058]|uniref:hypothetical protein n=1 Tax=Cohnella sp. GCM10020058 TaxID=3317330 RepID=UPI0036355ECA